MIRWAADVRECTCLKTESRCKPCRSLLAHGLPPKYLDAGRMSLYLPTQCRYRAPCVTGQVASSGPHDSHARIWSVPPCGWRSGSNDSLSSVVNHPGVLLWSLLPGEGVPQWN